MAAPSHLFTHKVVSQKTGRADKLVLLTSASETSAVLKARFYLDGFFIREHNGVKKWAGYCIVGSSNYYMHAEARHSWLRERRNGQDIVVFWDAGLNTFGHAAYSHTSSQMNAGVMVSVTSKAAWYVDTTNVSVKWKRTYDTVWQENKTIGHVQQTQINLSIPLVSDTVELTPNSSINIRICNYNAEGVFETPSYTVPVPSPQGFYATDSSYASFAYNKWNAGTPVPSLLYFDSWSLTVGARVFVNDQLSINVGIGYFADGTSWFRTDSNGEIIELGAIGFWPPGDPATPVRFVPISYQGYNSNWNTGCSNPSLWEPITVYLDNEDNVTRTEPNAYSSLLNGFFYTGQTAPNGSWEFVYYNNGVMDGYTYNCLDGFIIQA